MSKLTISTANNQQVQLNVLSFSSPLYAQISSAQTKTMAQHFPIKATQPDLQLSVIFPTEKEYEDFQKFVRTAQQDANSTANTNPNLLTLNWPERNIDNWTGVIRQFQAGGKRFNVAPRASFTVDLVDSLVSTRTTISQIPLLLWQTIYGAGMGGDAILSLPSSFQQLTGLNQFGSFVGTTGNLGGGLGNILSGIGLG